MGCSHSQNGFVVGFVAVDGQHEVRGRASALWSGRLILPAAKSSFRNRNNAPSLYLLGGTDHRAGTDRERSHVPQLASDVHKLLQFAGFVAGLNSAYKQGFIAKPFGQGDPAASSSTSISMVSGFSARASINVKRA
ncbi:MAG: hypothetical protein R3E58_12960 [Phycisphaerae bacterium]